MTTSYTQLVILLSMYLTIAGCLCQLPEPEPVPVVAFVLDASYSTAAQHRCAEVAYTLGELFKPSTTEAHALVFATGDQTSGFEPKTTVPWHRISQNFVAFEDPQASAQILNGELMALQKSCEKQLPSGTKHTPLYFAISRAVSAVRAKCHELKTKGIACSPAIHIHSDMVEEGHPIMTKLVRLALAGKTPLPSVPPLPTDGISITVCGISERQNIAHVRHKNSPPDALYRAWAGPLGNGRPPVFAPTCPRTALVAVSSSEKETTND